ANGGLSCAARASAGVWRPVLCGARKRGGMATCPVRRASAGEWRPVLCGARKRVGKRLWIYSAT
ncbi:MAG: hypothetical protein IJT83_08775, partial [Victivallales bacterium]|nr:hypothetical protein [Victivallales bacterium]